MRIGTLGENGLQTRILNLQEIDRIHELAQSPFRPPEIIKLKEEIESKKRLAVFHSSITGKLDEAEIMEIVNLKLKLDGLYGDWVQGKI